MTYIKINDTLYSAEVIGRMNDTEWDGRKSKSIKLEMPYETANKTFVDGLKWSIIQKEEVPVYDENGEIIDVKTVESEFDNSEYCLAGDLTDHRDGTVTARGGLRNYSRRCRIMTAKAKAIRTLYRAKRITKDGVKQAVIDGVISETEYKEITGEAYR